MLKFLTLFCLILVPTWSMETSREYYTCTQDLDTKSCSILNDIASIKLRYTLKEECSNSDDCTDFHTIDIILTEQGSPWSAIDMSLVTKLDISINHPSVNDNLDISISWPTQNVINFSWQWNNLYGCQDIVDIFPNNQTYLDVYDLLPRELFINEPRCPENYAKACKLLKFVNICSTHFNNATFFNESSFEYS